MKSKSPLSRSTLLLSACLSLPLTSRGAERIEELAKMMPASASVIFCVKSNPELLKDWDASGIGRFMDDPAAKKWMAPMYDKDGEAKWNTAAKEESGTSFRDGISINPGATVVGFDFGPLISGEATAPHVLELSEMKGKEKELDAALARKLEAMKKNAHPNAVMKTVDIAGEKVTVIADDNGEEAKWLIASVVVNDIQIEAQDQDTVEAAIASLKSGGDSKEKVEQLARIAEINGGTSDVTVLADLEMLVGMLKTKMAESAGKRMSPMGGAEQLILAAFGLEELKGLALTLDLNAGTSSGNFVLLHTEKPQGILPALLRGTSTEVPQPAFIPAGADGASVSRQSFAAIYDAIMAGIQRLGPMAAMMTGSLDQMEQKAGVSLRKDLFGSLDDVLAQSSTIKPGKTADGMPDVSEVTAVKLKDRAKFQAALDAVLAFAGNGFGMFEEYEFEGQKIHTLKPSLAGGDGSAVAATGATQIAYAVTDEYLLFCQGSQDMLQKVITRLKTKSADGSIWDAPSTQTALAALPKGYTGMGVSNGPSIMKTIAGLVTQMQSMAGGKTGASNSIAPERGPKGAKRGDKPAKAVNESATSGSFDPKAMPGEEVFARYFGTSASGSYSLPDATFLKIIALPVEAK